MAQEPLAGPKSQDPGLHFREIDLGSQVIQVPQYNTGEEAVIVWDSALVLAYFLLKHKEEFIDKSQHILELGAGTGAVGLVAASLGAKKVTVTDLPRFVSLLQESINSNSNLKANISAQALTWGQTSDLEALALPTPDLVLVSDCIYYEASVEPLISTLKELCCRSEKNCQILLSYEKRDYLESKKKIEAEFFRKVGEHFWIKPFRTSDCHEEFASDDIKVIRLMLK